MGGLDFVRTFKCSACGKRSRLSKARFASWSVATSDEGAAERVIELRTCPSCAATGPATHGTTIGDSAAKSRKGRGLSGFLGTFRDVRQEFLTESALGKKCENCGVREWPWTYETEEIDHYKTGSWWNRHEFSVVMKTHPACGYKWQETHDVTPSGA